MTDGPWKRTWLIGADARCDVVVDRPVVSARHCRLTETGDGFLLEDLNSSNGTFVNGRRIDSPVSVSQRDSVTLGRSVPMVWPDLAARGAIEPETAAKTVRIGRLPENDIVLDYPMVSGFHARILTGTDGHRLEDLGSTNGTAIGSLRNRITCARLSPGDAVYFGSLRVPASRLLSGNLALGNEPFTALPVDHQEMILGRDAQCDLVLDDPKISRRHARFQRVHDEMILEDLNSTNGTFVNGQRIKGQMRVQSGDVIAVGSYTFTVTADGNLQQRDWRGNVAIEAQCVSVDVGERRLLENLSLTVYPSEFVALMGPSGAGKTTLMNALNGYARPSCGTVRFNGQDLYANYGQFQGVIGYVPQDDIMHGELTVGQALYYTARLRLPADSSDEEIVGRVQKVISQLGLEGTENVLIGSPQRKGISGGQRKRVNLAMELLTDPAVLFLDEPTSGLSSEDALNVMRLLRRLADEGKTIVLTIHQPSLQAYRLLDNLILVAKDQGSRDPGRLVYYGPAYPQAVDFFNPGGVAELKPGVEPSPDEVLRGFSRKKTAEWAELYDDSPVKRQFVTDRAEKQPVAEKAGEVPSANRDFGFTQWWTLVRRCLGIKIKDTTNTAILMAQAPIIALLIALVFGNQASQEVTVENWPSVAGAVSTTVFLLALAALWFGCSNSAREIVGEWAIYRRERMVNLKIPSYVGSKFTVLGGLCFVQCGVLLGIVHSFAGLSAPWIRMFLVLLLVSLVGLAIGLTVSSLARTSEVAIALLPLILLPMVILAGVMQPVHKMNGSIQVLSHVMPSRWAFEGLLLLEVDERPTWVPPAMPARSSGSPATEPKDMADEYFPADTERMGVLASCVSLMSMLICFVGAIHVILRSRDTH